MSNKFKNSYRTISEAVKILNDNNTQVKMNNPHTIRYWEKQFKQIRPIKINNRRYYDQKNINILQRIQYLLKDQGMTINGVKKILNNEVSLKLDEIADKSIKAENLKNKLVKISKIVKQLK